MSEETIIDGVDVSGCDFVSTDEFSSVCKLLNCDCGSFKGKNCYYKQLQRIKAEYKKFSEYLPIAARLAKRFKTFEEAKGMDYDGILSEWIEENEELKKILKEIAEIAKTKIYTPVCFENPDCPKNGGTGFDNDCEKYCPLIMLEKILEKIKEGEK